MACTGIGPYTWYLYNSNWNLIDCADTSSTNYTFNNITTAGTYNVIVTSVGYTATTQFIVSGNESCCWDSNIYQPCNEGCSNSGDGVSTVKDGEDYLFTINNNYGAIELFFKKLNDSLGFNSSTNFNSHPFDVSVLYSSDVNKGSNVYFQGLLRSYECCYAEPGTEILFTSPCINEPVYKVLEFCNTCDTDQWISGYTFNQVCEPICPDGYILEPDLTTCSKHTITDVIISDITYTAFTGNQVVSYSSSGTMFFNNNLSDNLPYRITGDTTQVYDNIGNDIQPDTIINSGSLWYNVGNTSDGRLNSVGVWGTSGAPNPNLPLNEWIGFSLCINPIEIRKYYELLSGNTFCLGFACDNKIRVQINGELFFTSELSNGSEDFPFWKVFQMELPDGDNVIEFEGYNNDSQASLGFEIYFCDILTLSAMTSTTQLDGVTVYTTFNCRNEVIDEPVVFDVGEISGYICPNEYSLDLCFSGVPICIVLHPVYGILICFTNLISCCATSSTMDIS